MARTGTARRALTAVRNLWLQHPASDVLVAVALPLAAWALAARFGYPTDVLGAMAFADRMSLYTDFITVSGIFVGFSATGLAAYLALSGRNVDRLREVANGMVLKQWLAAVAGSGFVVFVFLACKAMDRQIGAAPVHWVATGAAVLLASRALRMIYVFAQLSGIATRPAFERSRSERQNHLRSAG